VSGFSRTSRRTPDNPFLRSAESFFLGREMFFLRRADVLARAEINFLVAGSRTLDHSCFSFDAWTESFAD